MSKGSFYIVKYREAIAKGNIVAGTEIITILDKLIADLDDPRYIYDTHDAYKRMDFMENCIRLTKSPFYGKPMVLMLWQKAWIEALYSFKMAPKTLNGDGTKIFDRFKKSLLLIGRKNCKSETCAALGNTEMILGNSGADIVCSSNDDKQAGIIYEAMNTMRLMIDPKQQDTWKNQQFIRNKSTNTRIWKLSQTTRNKEGHNVDFAIIDEVHEMRDNTIVKSIEQSQSLKDNPKLILITTEGFTNDGFLDEELIRARKILGGEDDGIAAERYLPWLYTQDSEQEVWQDERMWQKSNPSLGMVKKWDYLREQIDLARSSKADRMFVLSKDFNFKMSNSEAWLQESDYDYCAKFEIEDFRNSLCLGGVDLAETTDLACAKILLMKPEEKTKYIHTMYFIPESKLTDSDDSESGAKYSQWAKDGLLTIVPGNDIDLSVVADWFFNLYKDFGLRLFKCGYDQRFAKDFLRRMDEYGFECEMVNQNAYTMSNATKLVEADLKDQLINFNENPVDRFCLRNASIKIDNYGNILLVKAANQRSRRIDGAVTLSIVYEIFRRYKSDFLQNLE